jgi:hypothetical protein
MNLGEKSWTGRAAWNKLSHDDVLRSVTSAARRCIAAGEAASIERLRKRGAVGDNPRIAEARERLIASGKLAREACEGSNRAARKPAGRPDKPMIAALVAAEALAAGVRPAPAPEPTPIGLEIRAAMKRERDRRSWSFAAPACEGG